MKLIGLHKGTLENEDNKTNIGIPINLIINNINIRYIKCIYNIEKEKDIGIHKIINNGYFDYDVQLFEQKNNEIAYNFKIVIGGEIQPFSFNYEFEKTGKYEIYFYPGNKLSDLSYMFMKFII